MAYFDCIVGGSGKGNTLVVTCADELAGATITCTNGTKTYTKTCPSTSPYEVTFYGLAAGTWTVSATVSGNTYTATVVVVDCTALLGGFNWRTWVDTARFLDSTDYNSLEEVLADEEAVRELCLEHACVDYMAEIATASADVETIINTDLFAKWVNNSDYALDYLYANEIIADYMDTADKYGYGEWCLMPQVPTMTSNTAPYGTVTRSSVYNSSWESWKAFDGDESTRWIADATTNTQYIEYEFVNAVRINSYMFKLNNLSNAQNNYGNIYFKASNDGQNYVTLDTITASGLTDATVSRTVNNDNIYTKYRIEYTKVGVADDGFVTIQFYAWQPKGNVPIMTANNAPYGEAICSSNSSGYDAYKAFDKNASTNWSNSGSSVAGSYIGYKFTNPIYMKRFKLTPSPLMSVVRTWTVKIQASNDNSDWKDLTDNFVWDSHNEYEGTPTKNEGYYLYHRLYYVSGTSDNWANIGELQFYGRELSVSVPKMDTNTTPYGEVISTQNVVENKYKYYAFDGNDSTVFGTAESTTFDIGYVFTNPIEVRMFMFYATFSSQTNGDIQLQYSDNGSSWENAGQSVSYTSGNKSLYLVGSYGTHKRWRLSVTYANAKVDKCNAAQFYGFDYSEKEFEEGTTKKWLYDHGLELETLTASGYSISGVTLREAIKEPSQIYFDTFSSDGTGFTFMGTANAIDLTDYSYLMIRSGNKGKARSNNADFIGALNVKSTKSAGADGYINIKDMYYVNALDVSSFNQSKFATISSGAYNSYYTITELWLE